MTEIISVRFKNKGKIYFFSPEELNVNAGDAVIVETAKGAEYAYCVYGNHNVEDTAIVPPLRPVLRVATDSDKQKEAENKKKEAEALVICQEKIAKHGLEMKLVDVEYSFDGNKILFFFTSDGRIDFRDLVKELASILKARIELRQIGVRDEAKMLGGLGICGKPFCCSQFLDEFHPVSIKMAKTQGLPLNPAKISGACGRLMCCLKYEQDAYEDIVKKAPKMDSFVESPAGKGSVVNINILRGNAKVRLEDQADMPIKVFRFDELEVLGGKLRRAEYIAAKAEGRLAEVGFTESPKALEPKPFKKPSGAPASAQRPVKSAQSPKNTGKRTGGTPQKTVQQPETKQTPNVAATDTPKTDLQKANKNKRRPRRRRGETPNTNKSGGDPSPDKTVK